MGSGGPKPPRSRKSPAVTFREEPAGRETLAAIAEEYQGALRIRTGGRIRTTTKHYGDRISNAPGAVSPKTARAMDTSPEVTVSFKAAGRETYAALVTEYRHEVPDIEIITDEGDEGLSDEEWLASLVIEQVHTFVVHAGPQHFETQEQRMQLVEQRLLKQMPGVTMKQIKRVEITANARRSRIKVKVWTDASG